MDELKHAVSLACPAHGGPDTSPPWRPFPQGGHVEVAVEGKREGARNRRRGQQQDVGSGPLSDQGRPLLHPEAVLLVDHREAQPAEGHALLHQGVGPDHQPGRAVREARADERLLARRLAAQQELRSELERLQQPGETGRVLLGQELGGRHEGCLEVVLRRQEHREQGYDSLARPHVAHKEAVHPIGRGHVAGDFAQGALLIGGELPGERRLEPAGEIPPEGEGHPGALSLGHGAGTNQHELQVEQLVERQTPPTRLRLEGGLRPVHRPERLGERCQTGFGPNGRRHRVVGESDQGIEVPIDERADDLVAEAFGGRVHRQDPPRRKRIVAFAVREHDELAGRELPAMIEAHRAAHQDRLPDGDAAVEEGLPGPDALENAAVVPQHRVKDPKPATGGHNPFGHDPSYAGYLLADLGAGQRRHRGRVDVAVGEVPEKVARGADAESLELLRPALTDALEELDGHVESEGAGLDGSGPDGT